MNAVFHSDPPHPIAQSEEVANPIIPPEISEREDIIYTQASNQDELLSAFHSLADYLMETSGKDRYIAFQYSICYISEKMFPLLVTSNLLETISSILEIETSKNTKKEIDNNIYLMIKRCVIPFTQAIINDDQIICSFENSIIKSKLKKSIFLIRSIHTSIRLTQWVLNSNQDVHILQLILSSVRKIKMSAIPLPLATEIARCLIITTFILPTLSSSDLYFIRRDLIICIAKLLIDQPNSFANPSTIECLNYFNNHEIDYNKSNVNSSTNSLFPSDHKTKKFLATISPKKIIAFPAIDALRIPEIVPINSILQQIRITLFSVNIYDLNNLLNIASISLSAQSAIIHRHPEIIKLELENKIFFGRCLSIDTTSKYIKFDKTPKNIVELASFLRSHNHKKSGRLNALTKDLDKIIVAVYMSIKRLPRVSVDYQTLISSAKIMSYFISHVTHSKLIKYRTFKHNISLNSAPQTYPYSISSLTGNEDSKNMAKKIKKMLFKENFISLLPSSFTFISEMIADSQIASPLFPYFINSPTFSSSCCPQSLLLLSSFEELAKSLSFHPHDFISVLLNTRATPGRVKLLTVAIKNVIKCHMKNVNKNLKNAIKEQKKKSQNLDDENDDFADNFYDDDNQNQDDVDDEDYEYEFVDEAEDSLNYIKDSLFVDEETIEGWKRMIKVNLNEMCQFGLSILKVPSEITCKIAADFYLSIVTFISLFLSKQPTKGQPETLEKSKKASCYFESEPNFSFSYDDLYAILFIPISMFINIANALIQIEPLTNPRNAIFFLGFIERIISSSDSPDLTLKSTTFSKREKDLNENSAEQKTSENESYFKVTVNVNATAIIKTFIILNGPMPFWDCLLYMMNLSISSISGTLAARAIRIFAAISDFENTLQPRLSIAQRLVIDVLHNSIILKIIDMLNKITIENFCKIPPHEKCLISLALSELLLSWCEPLPLAAFVASKISPSLIDIIEKLSFSISDSVKNDMFTVRRASGSADQVMTVKQKQSLIFENSVLEILGKVKECFDFVLTQDYQNDLFIAQKSIPFKNITQKLCGLFFMVLESAFQLSDENQSNSN